MRLTIHYNDPTKESDSYFVEQMPQIKDGAALRFVPTDAAAANSRLASYGHPVYIPLPKIASWEITD